MTEDRLDVAVDPLPLEERTVDTPAGQLIAQLTNLDQRVPEIPPSFIGEYPGWLTWEAPELQNFTHFRLRVDQDSGDPDYEFPSGQRAVQIFRGRTFFLTAYNSTNGLESPMKVLAYDTEADLVQYVNESLAEEQVQVNYTMDSGSYAIPLAPYPQPGIRLTVFLTQDATGGRLPVWDSSFKNAPTTALDGTPSTLSVVDFVYRKVAGLPSGDDAWYCVGYETGLTTV